MNYNLFQKINGLSGHSALLDKIMIFTSQYALVIFAFILLFIWIRGNEHSKRAVLYAGLTGILAICCNVVISKFYFEPRPFVTHHVHLLIPHAKDASFPSDHTSGAFGLAVGMLFSKRKWGIFLLVIAVLTGFSRIYVGAHYPGDVLGSIVVSIISVFIIMGMKNLMEPAVKMVLHGYRNVTSRIPYSK